MWAKIFCGTGVRQTDAAQPTHPQFLGMSGKSGNRRWDSIFRRSAPLAHFHASANAILQHLVEEHIRMHLLQSADFVQLLAQLGWNFKGDRVQVGFQLLQAGGADDG